MQLGQPIFLQAPVTAPTASLPLIALALLITQTGVPVVATPQMPQLGLAA